MVFALWIGNLYWQQSWYIPKCANSISFFILGTICQNLKRETMRHFFFPYSWLITLVALAYFFHPLVTSDTFKLPNASHSPLYSIAGCICILSYGATIERFLPRLARLLSSFAPAIFFMYAAHIPAFSLYSIVATRWHIPSLPPHIFPVYTIIFMSFAFIVFKLAQRTRYRSLLAWVFLHKSKQSPSLNWQTCFSTILKTNLYRKRHIHSEAVPPVWRLRPLRGLSNKCVSAAVACLLKSSQ